MMVKKKPTRTQRNLRVVQHSLAGAFWGWFSTYVIFCSLVVLGRIGGVLGGEPFSWSTFIFEPLIYFILLGVSSFFVTLAGWVFVGLPIAVIVTDRQVRNFRFMITVHTFATVIVATIPTLLPLFSSPSEIDIRDLPELLFNFITVWAAAIGVIGGAVFCKLERRS